MPSHQLLNELLSQWLWQICCLNLRDSVHVHEYDHHVHEQRTYFYHRLLSFLQCKSIDRNYNLFKDLWIIYMLTCVLYNFAGLLLLKSMRLFNGTLNIFIPKKKWFLHFFDLRFFLFDKHQKYLTFCLSSESWWCCFSSRWSWYFFEGDICKWSWWCSCSSWSSFIAFL